MREAHESIDIIRISFTEEALKKHSHISSSRKVNHQIDIARGYFLQAKDTLRHNRRIEQLLEKGRSRVVVLERLSVSKHKSSDCILKNVRH